MRSGKLSLRSVMLTGVAASVLAMSAAAAQAEAQSYDIEAQDLGSALQAYALQSGRELFFAPELVEGHDTNGLSGVFSSEAALANLLRPAGLTFSVTSSNAILIVKASDSGDSAQEPDPGPNAGAEAEASEDADTEDEATPANSRERDAGDDEPDPEAQGRLDIITVRGSRNVGIRRYEDDVQPYVVFNSDDIESSLATSLEDFLRTRLPQNSTQGSSRSFTSGSLGLQGNRSSVALRGLSADQTLILVNGRRAPRVSANGGTEFEQADINGIPLGLIERIEVLPATASGIYGGGATGGVINIITRRDYVGAELNFDYGNAFDTDVAERRVEGSAGFSLEGGRTSILISASYADSGELLSGDRDFARRSRDLLLANDPSALNTASPLSATTNVRSLVGNLVLKSGANLGSNITFVPYGYAGVSSDGGQALVNNAGSYNLDLPQAFDGLRQPLIQAPAQESASISVRREFTPRVAAFFDASIFRNEGQTLSSTLPRGSVLFPSSAGNPFNNIIFVSYPTFAPALSSRVTSETIQFNGGATIDLVNDWALAADYSWSRSRLEGQSDAPGFNTFAVSGAISSGQIDIFRDFSDSPPDLSAFEFTRPGTISGPFDTILTNVALRATGPLWELPAGSINMSAVLERREEVIEESFSDSINFFSAVPGTFQTFYSSQREQSVNSLYVETLIPVVSEQNARPGVQIFEVQASIRHDDYETRGPSSFQSITLTSRDDTIPSVDNETNRFSSTDFTLGLKYAPTEDIIFRASYGTGFLPPSVHQVFTDFTPQQFFFNVVDPLRGGVASNIQADSFFGGSPDLRPEESESFSAGVILTPRFLSGFRLSVDYTLIEKDDEISSISRPDLLALEAELPGRIVRAPLTPTDAALGFTGGEILSIDQTLINLARTTSESVDIQFDQYFETERIGEFRIYAIATYLSALESQILPTSEVRDSIGFDGGALEWRGNIGVTWTGPDEALRVGWNAQYYDDYFVYRSTDLQSAIDQSILRHGTDKISSQIYHDLWATFDLNALEGRLGAIASDTQIRLGIQNVFDTEPTVRPAAGLTDSLGRYSAYGDVRLRRYTIGLRKSF